MVSTEEMRNYRIRLNEIASKKERLAFKRSETLNAAVDMQLATATLAKNEAQRLARRNPNDSRIAALKARAAAVSVTTNALKAMAATIANPDKGGAVLEGRITNLNGLTAGPVTVQLFDGKGRELAQPVKTDATGYYAFNLDPAAVKAIIAASAKLSISITIAGLGAPLAQTTVESSMIAAGKSVSVDIALEATELEKLGRLHSPAATAPATPPLATAAPAAATPVASTPAPAPGTAAAPTTPPASPASGPVAPASAPTKRDKPGGSRSR